MPSIKFISVNFKQCGKTDYGEEGEDGDGGKSEAGSNYFDEDSDDERFLVKQDMAGRS